MDFDSFVKDIELNKWNVYGATVYKDGKLIHSYGDVDGIYDIYSCTKSIFSIALGIAYDRGLIDFDKTLLDYIPKDLIKLDESKRKIYSRLSLKRFMTMSVDGYPFRPEGNDYLNMAFECDLKDVDTPIFSYSNFSPYLVSVALTHAVGEDIGTFIENNIFKPMGIVKYEYERCPGGYFYSASKMKLSVNDMAKIGVMLSNGGVYDGKRIVSNEYVTMATSVQQANKEGGYGYYFWKYRDGFSINGKWKQKVYCLPKDGLVIAYLSLIKENSHELLHSMEKYLLGIGDDNKTIPKESVSD